MLFLLTEKNLEKVLNFVEKRNGVRVVDVAEEFKTNVAKAKEALVILGSRGKIYEQEISGKACRWYTNKTGDSWRIQPIGEKMITYY